MFHASIELSDAGARAVGLDDCMSSARCARAVYSAQGHRAA